MKYLFLLSIISVAITSCQIEDPDAPAPDEAFIKYFGELTSYTATDIEIVYDGGGVPQQLVVFGSKTSQAGDDDYFVLRTDLEGNLIDSVSYGFTNNAGRDLTGDGNPDVFIGDEIGGQIQPLAGGGFITIGTSSITDNNRGISDFRILTAGILNESLELQNDTLFALVSSKGNPDLDLIGNDVITLSDGSVLFVGAKEFDRGGGVTDFDNYFLKFDFTDRVVFDGVQGVHGDGEDEIAVRVFEKPGRNIVIVGDSNTPSDRGENGGDNGTNVQLLEIDENGSFVNTSTYGINAGTGGVVSNESVKNAIMTPSGFTIVGTTVTSQNDEFAFVMSTTRSGVFLSGNLHDSSAYEGIETRGLGVTLAANSDVIILGQYPSFNFLEEGQPRVSRGGEGMFVRFDQACRPVDGVESFFGLADGNDQIVDAVTLPDGKVIAVANVDFGGGVRLISIMKLNADGSLD
ncbi:hypothetical protein SAMN05421640_0853 [Ekhidna lutea]|uniref:Delta-60 repeat domain-containing protein n=1 Tax=Ekhidna lutea TaxID=447679 RepID=A0A239GHX5_EKHLU|nr:delta-60 repeat domain-containing protein [Ekhidna lutea]SNS68739.1 hypothetical protein SAMN05421640_0853 [Ekhidna lutea]